MRDSIHKRGNGYLAVSRAEKGRRRIDLPTGRDN